MKTTKRLYTVKRLYFTCRIKALYMMKEFGVKFEWRQKVKCSEYDIFHEYKVGDLISDELKYGKISDAIYVAIESEHIFEPEEGDIGLLTEKWSRGEEYYIVERKHWGSLNLKHNYKWFKGKEEVCTTKKVEITMRDNTQFFMPEVEND